MRNNWRDIKLTLAQEIAINDIMNNFDFSQVWRTMSALDWGWGSPPKVPSVEDIRATARELLTRVTSGETVSLSTGGFGAYYEHESLILRFVLEEWDTGFIE